MASWIVNLIVAGTAIGIGAIGSQLIGDSVKEDHKGWRLRRSIGPFTRVTELDRDTANTAAGQHEPVNKLHAVAL